MIYSHKENVLHSFESDSSIQNMHYNMLYGRVRIPKCVVVVVAPFPDFVNIQKKSGWVSVD